MLLGALVLSLKGCEPAWLLLWAVLPHLLGPRRYLVLWGGAHTAGGHGEGRRLVCIRLFSPWLGFLWVRQYSFCIRDHCNWVVCVQAGQKALCGFGYQFGVGSGNN